MKPLFDKILVEPAKKEEKTKGGIIIPTSAQEEKAEGKVIELGTGLKDGKEYKFSVKKGDKVIYSKYAGDEITIEGKEYKIMKEEEILGIL